MKAERCQPAKIVILADSLALPRGEDAGDIPYEFTYPVLLEDMLRQRFGEQAPRIIERGQRLRTVLGVLADWHEQVELVDPAVVVVHVGVVDCAPRVFLPLEHRLVGILRPRRLRDAVLRFVNRHRRKIIQLRPNRVYVPLGRFEKGVRQLLARAGKQGLRGLIFVNIIAPPDDLEYRSPGFRRKVERYNQVLQDLTPALPGVQLIDYNRLIWQEGDPEALLVDGVHPNRMGHHLLAEELERRIIALLEMV